MIPDRWTTRARLLAWSLCLPLAALIAAPAATAATSPLPTAPTPRTASTPLSILDADDAMILGWASHSLTTMATEEKQFSYTNGMLSTYVDFVQSPGFPHKFADAAARRGSALLIAWEPWNWSLPAGQQPQFAPRNIAAGQFDAHLKSWLAQAATRTDEAEIIVRFAPEMDDSARPWSSGTAPGATTPAEYIAMWRHVYALKQAIAPEVVFLWNPLNYGAGPYPFETYYPGAAYVDALALDGFNWSNVRAGSPGWQSAEDVFGFARADGPVVRLKALANGKPWGIAETASAPDKPTDFQPGGPFFAAWGTWVYQWPENPPYEATAADWITQEGWTRMVIERARDHGASFVNLFHTNKETDWRLTDTAVGRTVFRDAS